MSRAAKPDRPLRLLVVDDEAPARANVVALLRDDPEFAVVGEAGSGTAAVECIRELEPDIVVLDVQMPDGDGFRVIERLGPEAMPAVVFVTAYDEFAVKAFEARAVDYLVKPYSEARLREALDRAAERVRESGSGTTLRALVAQVRDGVPGRLVVRDGESTRFVSTRDVDWIEADDYYAKVHVNGDVFMLRQSLAALEERLDPRQFVRIHRSSIVNLDRVRELSPWSGGSYAVVLDDGTRLTLSRRRRAHLEEVLGQSL